MGYFSDACQYLAKRDPLGLSRWLIGPFLQTHRYLGFVDTSLIAFPGESPRTCDTVAEFESLADASSRTLVDFEFQTEPHPDMLERTGEYAYRLRRELRFDGHKYRVLSVVTYLSGAPQPSELDMREESLNIGILQRILVWALREESAEELLDRIIQGALPRTVLPWVVLMRGADQADIMQQWRDEVLREGDVHIRSELVGIALVFAEVPNRQGLWKKALEGTMERTPSIILEWQAQARAEGEAKGKAEGRAEGKVEGRAEGKVEGRAEGEVKGEANGLRLGIAAVLELRFGTVPGAEVMDRLTAQTDPTTLKLWLDKAKSVTSVDDFMVATQGS